MRVGVRMEATNPSFESKPGGGSQFPGPNWKTGGDGSNFPGPNWRVVAHKLDRAHNAVKRSLRLGDERGLRRAVEQYLQLLGAK